MQHQRAPSRKRGSPTARPTQGAGALEHINHLIHGTHRMNGYKPAYTWLFTAARPRPQTLGIFKTRRDNPFENLYLPFTRRVVARREVKPHLADESARRGNCLEPFNLRIII